MSQQHITVLLSNRGGLQCNCTLVYASNSFLQRQKLRGLLCLNASTIGLPWFVMGDCNNDLTLKDKRGGLPIPFTYLNTHKIFLITMVWLNPIYRGANTLSDVEE